MTKSGCDHMSRMGGTKLMQDYLAQSEQVKEFVIGFPSDETMLNVAKNHSFFSENRTVLFEAVQEQYAKGGMKVPSFWESIKKESSFTITTGHQLNLFGGPKYFIYKIVSVIKQVERLNAVQDDYQFLPVFWMATEDHDFEEINRVKLFDQVIQSKEERTGAVGRVEAAHFKNELEELKKVLGTSKEANELAQLFEGGLDKDSLAAYTRRWVHDFFEGKVIIVDGDDVKLKKQFMPVVHRELSEQITDQMVSKSNKQLEEKGYHVQVGHRAINLFYLAEGVRERIGASNGEYKVHNEPIEFHIGEVSEHPERISPNALLRPVYQETVLPNVAYIGGPGELAYWFQLKKLFEALDTSFPALILRDSFLFVKERDKNLLSEFGLCIEELMLREEELFKRYITKNGLKKIVFDEEHSALSKVMDQLTDKISDMHRDYQPMLEAERARIRKFIEKMELRAMRDAKFREDINLKKLRQLRERYFPGGGLVERTSSFMEEYLLLGKEEYLRQLMEVSNPLDSRIKVLTVNK